MEKKRLNLEGIGRFGLNPHLDQDNELHESNFKYLKIQNKIAIAKH